MQSAMAAFFMHLQKIIDNNTAIDSNNYEKKMSTQTNGCSFYVIAYSYIFLSSIQRTKSSIKLP